MHMSLLERLAKAPLLIINVFSVISWINLIWILFFLFFIIIFFPFINTCFSCHPIAEVKFDTVFVILQRYVKNKK